VVLGLDAWFRRTTTSFVNLLDITWGEARPVPPEGLVTVLQHAVDVVSSARSEATPPADSWEAWLVPFHFVAFTLSPLLAVVLAAVLLLWLLRCRRGLAFAAIALLGEVAVIYLVAGPGDRWMLVLCPAFGVIAGLGFLQMKPRSLRVAAPVCVLLGLFLAVDYHHVLRSSAGRDAVSSVLGLPDAFAWRGLGAASSLDPVGWTRRDVKGAAPSFLPQKEALWSAVTACGAELVVVEDPGVQVQETPAWWHYRNQLEALDGDGDLRHIVTLAGSIYSADMVTPSASAPAVAMLLSERGDRPPAGELLGAGWSRGGTYPSGTPQWAPVTVWVRGEAASCAEP